MPVAPHDRVDALIFGPHPDDIEILAGGLALMLRAQGRTVGGIDLTGGEAGTRGTPEQRADEARRGGEILGLAFRENLGLPDGGIENDAATRDLVIDAIRRHRPALVVAPQPDGHHPDHLRAGHLIREARFLAGCARVGPPGDPWRPGRVLYYPSRKPSMPDLVVDVTPHFATKMDAIRAHRSQLHDASSTEPTTTISSPDFLDVIEADAVHYGAMIGARYGEAFQLDGPVAVDDPIAAVRDRGHIVFHAPEDLDR